ncbi:WASH complex subunit 2 [Ixodes scapularis]
MNSVGDVEAGSSKPWDQPLSTEDMRNRASNWSLADDSQLLAYLECVSRNITSRSYEIQKELDSLIHETRVSGVKVNNVINDFNHLSSLQFIENRVYDEEAREPEKAQSEAQAESKEQQEAELVRRMRDAFQHGVQVVRSSLEFVDLNQEGDSDEDSEDEGAPPAEPLFRSRDPYLHRALPLLIGSQAFVQDDRVGLGDLLSEDEEEEEKSSRGEYESDRSESDFDEEKEAKAPADTKMAQAMLREYGNHLESSEEELFDQKAELHSASSESEPDSDADLLPSEPPPKRGSVSSRRSEGAGSVRRREEDLFGVPSDGEMFTEAEEQSPFKKRGGAFSSPRKLFDDDEDDEKVTVEQWSQPDPASLLGVPAESSQPSWAPVATLTTVNCLSYQGDTEESCLDRRVLLKTGKEYLKSLLAKLVPDSVRDFLRSLPPPDFKSAQEMQRP